MRPMWGQRSSQRRVRLRPTVRSAGRCSFVVDPRAGIYCPAIRLCGGDSALCCPPTGLQHTARGSERWSFLDFLLPAGASYASVDEFSVELTYAVASVFVFPEFCLCETPVKRLSFGAKDC